ncbi:MAG TPA: PA2169 family four-helix-bundle protein [Allosphingosinicella sp.]|nr:PA2169 family four-helix-bundle protein [Allosphingosinicella sp.]
MLGPDSRDSFDKSHDISVLNSLIETTIDSVDGYRRSAQEATNSRFSAGFLERASEREQIVSQLRDQVRKLGGNPEDDGSVLAAAHRTFLSLRDKVTGSDDTAVIAEVDHGESYLNGKWETALKDDRLSPETRALIQQCYGSVREGRDTFRRLHEDMSATTGSGGTDY